MKITANRESLLDAMSAVWPVVPTKTTKPILRNVKLVADDETRLIATNLEVGITRRVPGVDVSESGAAILPARVLAILKASQDEELIIEADEDHQIRIRGVSSDFHLTSEDPVYFPDVPEFAAPDYWIVPSGPLGAAIRQTIFAVDETSTRYALGGLLWEFALGVLNVIATDGRRLAHFHIPLTSESSPRELLNNDRAAPAPILPVSAMKLLQRTLSDDDLVHVAIDPKNSAIFRTADADIWTRLKEGRFPVVDEVFPSEPARRLEIPVAPFLGGLQQAAIATSDDSRGVDLHFGPNLITMKAQASNVGTSSIEVPITSEGLDVGVTFDPQYLIPMLHALPDEASVVIHIIDDRYGVVFAHGDDYRYVVMPLTRNG